MHESSRSRSPRPRLGLLVAAILAGLVVAGCGSSSGGGGDSASTSAQSLIRQTFSSGHTVKSGVLHFALTLDPSGSSTLTSPVSLGLDGPFASRGKGNLPASDFTISIAALGRTSSLGLVSTGTRGYVKLQGDAYQLPRADVQRLESGFSSAGASGTSQGGLAGLGINPQHWLTAPTVVGSASVGGTDTTHIRAGVDVGALLEDLNTLLARTAAKTGRTKLPSSISPATARKISAAVRNATVDLWTGKTDKTLRKLALNLMVTGKTATLLRGLRTARISLIVRYADLNQPQTISAPTNVRPYKQLSAQLQGLTSALQGAGAAGQGAGSSAPASESKYTQCLQQAGRDVRRMQKCASLLNTAA